MAVEIIAELGTAHGGDLGAATTLIEAAAAAGADCCKVQIIFADEILHPASGSVTLTQGTVDLYKRFRHLERDLEFYNQLRRRCQQQGCSFLASIFGPRSLAVAQQLGVRRIKIASPELNHIPLLREAARGAEHLILSSGVSRLSDIERALHYASGVPLTLLHCVTAYPAPEEESNLRLIPHLRALLGVAVGLSDHTAHPTLVPALATLCGAIAIEKHLTLDSQGTELDDPFALSPLQLSEMCRSIRKLAERPAAEAWASLKEQYGEQRVERILGDGIKRLAASEEPHYGHTNRSIMALRDIAVDEALGAHNCAILRSEGRLPGLAPHHWDSICGAFAQQPIAAGCGLQWSDLLVRQ